MCVRFSPVIIRGFIMLGKVLSYKEFYRARFKFKKLNERIISNNVQETFLLSATIEGQTTALVIKDKLEKETLKITQLAYGVQLEVK